MVVSQSIDNYVKNSTVSGANVSLMKQAQNFLKSHTNIKDAIVSIYDNTGIAGFQFIITRMEQVKLSNDITDYYSDSNTVFNDHIAHKPVTVTVSGLQGEYFYSVHKIKDMISAIGTTLKLVAAFKPQFDKIQGQMREKWESYQASKQTNGVIGKAIDPNFTPSGLTLKEKLGFVKQAVFSYNSVDLFKLFQSLYKFTSAQTRAYLFFEVLSKADKPFTIETRWKRFDNMYIQDVTVTGEDNADITEFQVTFKQLNFTHSEVVSINAAGRTQQQYYEEANKGIDNGTKLETI
jgi:hypothetical protein